MELKDGVHNLEILFFTIFLKAPHKLYIQGALTTSTLDRSITEPTTLKIL